MSNITSLKKAALDMAAGKIAISSKYITDVFPISFDRYTHANERTALLLGKIVASLNLADYPALDCLVCSPYEMWVKDYSELEGVADCLLKSGLFAKVEEAVLSFPTTRVVLVRVSDQKLKEAIDKVHGTKPFVPVSDSDLGIK